MNDLERTPRYPLGPTQAQPYDRSESIDISGPGSREDAGLFEYWHMVRRHKGAIVLFAFLGAIGGFLLTLASPRIYQARTTIEIQGYNNDFLNMGSVTPTMMDAGYDAFSDIQTHIRILQSRSMVERASKRLETMPRPVDLQPPDRLGMWRRTLNIIPPTPDELFAQALGTAAGGVAVRNSGTNRIVEMTCDSTSGQLAADFCNTLAQQYIDQNLESRWQSTEYTGQWLTKQLQDLKIKIEQSQDEVQSYLRQTGLIVTAAATAEGDAADSANAQEVRLNDLLKELSAAQNERIIKQSRFEMATVSPATGLPEVLDDESLRASQASLLELQTKLAQLSVTFTPNNAEVRKIRAQIAAIEGALQSSRGDIMTRIRNEFEAAQRREALILGEYGLQARLVSGQAEQTAHYNLLRREVDASRMLYDNLLQRTKEASVASALRANNIRIIDPAQRQYSPYSPNVTRQATIGLLFGLILGVGFVIVRERADRTLQDPGDISYHLGVPELGVIPVGEPLAISKREKSSTSSLLLGGDDADVSQRVEMVAYQQKTSLLAESYRTTLTSILFSRKTGEGSRILVFTSASPKEGKTTTVCNLGISMAEINQSVLLIDADMRRPRLHSVFNIENNHGLSDLLMERTPLTTERLREACVPSGVPGLYVLPSGSSRRNASSLLHSPRFPELLRLAREQFDTTAIDTPPMVNISDARVVARYGDGLILIVRSGITTRDAAMIAVSRFAEDGIPILGSILNFWNPKSPGYSYYRYYYSGYYHYYGPGGGDDDGGSGPGVADESSTDGRRRRPKRGLDLDLDLRPEFHRSPDVRES